MKLINKLLLLLCLAAFILMSYSRGTLVQSRVSELVACDGCYQTWAWQSDLWLLILLFLLLFAGAFLKNYFFRFSSRLLAVALLGICWLDFYIFKTLVSRVYFSEMMFYFDFNAISEFWRNETGQYAVAYAVLVGILVGLFLFLHQQIKPGKKQILLISGVLILAFVVLLFESNKIRYVHDDLMRNLASVNLSAGQTVPYSDDYLKNHALYHSQFEALSCDSNGLGLKKNVILVVIESLSSYHSKKLSGLNDWTPLLDKLSDRYLSFDNFFANNFNSVTGRLALINGEKTFREVVGMMHQARRGYRNSQRNLARLFNQEGYHTAFLDGADLDFTKTGDYMHDIGFQFVEGHDSPYYKGQPRYAFESVSDDVLYRRVLDYAKQAPQPYFTTVITVTSHHPYIDPISKNADIGKTVQFADQAFYDFYQALKSQGFFENGLLIATSDHRAMMPVFEDEIERFGEQALSRIPMIVIGKEFEGRGSQSEYLQQSDLLNSLEYYVSGEHCARKGEGNLFSVPVKAAACIYHNRGDYRDRIDVYCDNGSNYAQVQLNGDDTSIISGALPDEESVIRFINASRIAAQHREKEFQQGLANQKETK
jgi:hypothetical protein